MRSDSVSVGSSPSSTVMNRSAGTYLAITTRHTVSGMASTSPMAPHSHVQKIAAMIMPSPETPMLLPYRSGSATLLTISSSTTNTATTSRASVQLSETAIDTAIGSAAEIHGPM